MWLAIAVGTMLILSIPGAVPAWARGPRQWSPGLWIVADRIVGFVPFTVSVYGRVLGSEPGQLELCRSEVAWIAESSSARVSGQRSGAADPGHQDEGDDPCSSGHVVRTPDGYDYSHDMRFERPGVYHVQLTMIDAAGRRRTSNTVQVNAF